MAKRRKKGEGSVRQRKDGRWEGRVVIGYDEKGLPRTKNVLAKTKRECQEKLKQLRDDVLIDLRLVVGLGGGADLGLHIVLIPEVQPLSKGHLRPDLLRPGASHRLPKLL